MLTRVNATIGQKQRKLLACCLPYFSVTVSWLFEGTTVNGAANHWQNGPIWLFGKERLSKKAQSAWMGQQNWAEVDVAVGLLNELLVLCILYHLYFSVGIQTLGPALDLQLQCEADRLRADRPERALLLLIFSFSSFSTCQFLLSIGQSTTNRFHLFHGQRDLKWDGRLCAPPLMLVEFQRSLRSGVQLSIESCN